MTRYANKFDLDDPEVIDSYAQFIEGEQRLRFLYVHTYCDANATAPDLWNDHKEELHTQLFTNTLNVLEGKHARKDPSTLKNAYLAIQVEENLKDELKLHLENVPERYFSHTSKEEVALHVDMVNRFKDKSNLTNRPILSWRNDVRRALTIVDIVTNDRPALFEKIAGGFSVAGLNILGARAVTRNDGIAIDIFYVEEGKGGIVSDSKTRKLCEKSIHSFLENENSPEKQIKDKKKKIG